MAAYDVLLRDGGYVTLDFDDATAWEAVANVGEGAGALALLTRDRKVVLLSALRGNLEQYTANLVNAAETRINGRLPVAIAAIPRGAFVQGTAYNVNEVVSYTLPDGRVGSFLCRVNGTTDIPLGSDNWQINALPALGGGGGGGGASVGFVSFNLSDTGAIDMAVESRWVGLKNASRAITFTNLSSKGNALLALTNPPSGTPGTVTWPANTIWDTTDGQAPALTLSPGRGDVFLVRCWDGVNPIVSVSQTDVAFNTAAAATIPQLTDTRLLYLYKNDVTRLKNLASVAGAAGDDLTTFTGTARSPLGLDFAASQDTFTDGVLEKLAFGPTNPWFIAFLVQGAAFDRSAAGAPSSLGLISLYSPTDDTKYVNVRTANSGNGPMLQVFVRDGSGGAGAANPSKPNDFVKGVLRLYPGTPAVTDLTMVGLWYDGAGQYGLWNMGTDDRLYDTPTTAYTTEGYPGSISTKIGDFSAGLALNVGSIRRQSGILISGPSRHRYLAGLQRVLTQAERRTLYNNAKDYLAQTDPSGPQLPAPTY